MAENPLRTVANAVPPVDDTDLGDMLDELYGIDPDLDAILDKIRHLLHARHTRDQSQSIVASLAGSEPNLIAVIGLTLQRLADPDTNPALRELPLDQQKKTRLAGEQTAYALTDPNLRQHAARTAAAIDGH